MVLDLSKKSVQWIVLAALAFVWGSSYFLIKKGLRTFDETELAALRIAIAFIILAPIAIYNLKKIKKSKILPLFLVGALGSALPAFLFAKAQTTLSSSVAGILNSIVPVFTMLIGVTLFKTKFLKINILGLFIGLIGAVTLIWVDKSSNITFDFMGAVYVVLATICYGISVNVIKESLPEISSMEITSFAFLFIGIPVIPILLLTNFTEKLVTHEAWMDLGYITLLSVFGTALAILYFNKLIKHTSAIFATTVTYLIPIVAVMWGVLDGEPLTVFHFMACLIILVGVYLVNKKAKSNL